ncbi:MAG TPA: DNA-3-methyladenine glycosylase, partial [Alphaproteobacteria bacterium]|nr:DNA-3-methyladenine glycosylase [Alphaproteobacteria bacterium]
GYTYVYRAYGLHWCLNFVCEGVGIPCAVLIRAIEPHFGIPTMQARRRLADIRLLCSGPGRVCEALGLTRAHDGLALDSPPFEIRGRLDPVRVARGVRIGITKAADKPWRYGLMDSRFLSRPLKREGALARTRPTLASL